MPENVSDLLFQPSDTDIEASRGFAFMRFVEEQAGVRLFKPGDSYGAAYQKLHCWSVEHLADFHALAWDFCALIGEKGALALENPDHMLEARFFPQGRISFAENMLARAGTHPDEPAIISRVAGRENEDRVLSWKALYDAVSLWAQVLERLGVGEGDRISVYLPHIPEAYILLIAAAQRGAIFSSVGTEMGTEATLDRFLQIKPKVLIAADGYLHVTARGEKREERLGTVRALQEGLKSLEHTIVIPCLDEAPDLGVLKARTSLSSDLLRDVQPGVLDFERRDFNHPLAILFSSGSTGAPKCFVHGAGNLLLKHAIEHQLHCDTRPGDRVFYHTTVSWMMFNWLAGGLAQGAAILIHDGNPAYPGPDAHLAFAMAYGCTHLGTAAGVIQDVWRAGAVHMNPDDPGLSPLRALSYTASVLSPEGYRFVHEHIKADMSINGICGGTDFVGCYAGGNPFAPTCAGPLKGPILGMAVEVWDEAGRPVEVGSVGELVITKPFVSRPLYFWGDEKTAEYPHGQRFTESYFTHFADRDPPVWRHGDAVRFLESGQMIVEGRSDSTLNQNGVRIGSQVLYDALDHPALKSRIADSIAVTFKDAEGGDHTALFIVPADGADNLDPALHSAIKAVISDTVGRLCVPHEIRAVPYILKTPNGKKAEKPTREALAGEPPATPETYGKDPHSGAYKADLFAQIGAELRAAYKAA